MRWWRGGWSGEVEGGTEGVWWDEGLGFFVRVCCLGEGRKHGVEAYVAMFSNQRTFREDSSNSRITHAYRGDDHQKSGQVQGGMLRRREDEKRAPECGSGDGEGDDEFIPPSCCDAVLEFPPAVAESLKTYGYLRGH